MNQLRKKLQDIDITTHYDVVHTEEDMKLLEQWKQGSNVFFTAQSTKLSSVYEHAISSLLACIKPTLTEKPILHEGGIYYGCWLESTGRINNELLSRFLPKVAEETYLGFATFQEKMECYLTK